MVILHLLSCTHDSSRIRVKEFLSPSTQLLKTRMWHKNHQKADLVNRGTCIFSEKSSPRWGFIWSSELTELSNITYDSTKFSLGLRSAKCALKSAVLPEGDNLQTQNCLWWCFYSYFLQQNTIVLTTLVSILQLSSKLWLRIEKSIVKEQTQKKYSREFS